MFVVIEGIDRSGKSFLIEELKKVFPDFVFTREPGGLKDTTCEAIRKILKDPNIIDMDNITEALLFSASRNQHNIKIKKLLKDNQIVISDRYVYSSLVYQGIYRQIGLKTVEDINKYSNIIEPDLIIYLRLSDFEEYRRRGERNITEGNDRIEGENQEFFETVKTAYDEVLKNKNNVKIINASLSKEEIIDLAKKYIKEIKER